MSQYQSQARHYDDDFDHDNGADCNEFSMYNLYVIIA